MSVARGAGQTKAERGPATGGSQTAGGKAAGATNHPMIRIFLAVVLVGIVLLGAGIVYLGAFPPAPHPQPVEKVLPNDKFQGH